MSFLEVEGWGDKGRVVHGFGMRDQTWGKRPKQDWRGQPLTVGEEIFTLLSTRQVHGDGVVVFKGKPREPEQIWMRGGCAGHPSSRLRFGRFHCRLSADYSL